MWVVFLIVATLCGVVRLVVRPLVAALEAEVEQLRIIAGKLADEDEDLDAHLFGETEIG